MKIAGIYLAAGNSSRMGSNKLALPVGTKTLGSLAVETALQSSLQRIYIITKENDDRSWLSPEVQSHAKSAIIPCATAHEGQAISLRCGIQQAQSDQMDAVLIMLADQPFITVQMIEEMIACAKENPSCRFVATALEGTILPPVFFPSAMYNDLLKLHGDIAAKAILQGEFLQHGKLLPCKDQRLVFDIDTKEQYKQLFTERTITK
ncbi:NTP transferase domain-containing protein [Sporosarcina soli]|uniref:NTP transferase domain-containing protein n=1 Tax=Sporosarcina soli TaxID=334736 RepID=A0ABW0TDI6_9BACL